MRCLKFLCVLIAVFGWSTLAEAHINPELQGKSTVKKPTKASYRSNCAPSTSYAEQNINNVRAGLRGGGDVWWDGDGAQYVVPNIQVDPVSAIFAGSVWLGGEDPGGALKLAAQTYRNNGNDFWPGPLTEEGETSADTCLKWDKHFRVLGENVRLHIRNYRASCDENGENCNYDCSLIPSDVKGWPGRGNPFFSELHGFDLPDTKQGLAGFHDENGDQIYNPCDGDYPLIEIRGCEERDPESLVPDEMIFWIYNDNGNVHTQTTGSVPIQMEVQVQAFAYEGTDQLNDMTFQRYKLINRANNSILNTYFAMWVDPDLGCHLDDFIGCDIDRSLAYDYNSDDFDEDCTGGGGAVNGYEDRIPIVGVDYFRGPLDEFGDEIGMSSFTYYNNSGSGQTGDPTVDFEYYNYITGRWRDGTPFTRGGTGYNTGSTDTIAYAFPSAPNDISSDAWSMCSAGLSADDRRTIQASGPFELIPGAVNELIIGVVWVPDQQYPCPDPSALFAADEIAQNLFDECFNVLDGPDAPEVDWIELDREIIAVFSNEESSNNFELTYSEKDIRAPVIHPVTGDTLTDSLLNYVFEGYKLYQVAYPDITDLSDPETARLVAQVDLKNGIKDLYNWEGVKDPNSQDQVFVPELQVEANDAGIFNTVRITRDLFASGNEGIGLVNHKKYYYRVVAYAYNDWLTFDINTREGQKRPYLEGRRIRQEAYVAIPRPIVNRRLQSNYGDGAVITRLDGVGAGGNFLDVSDEQRMAFLDPSFDGTITYLPGAGPIDVKIYNPIDIVEGKYQLVFVDENTGDDILEDTARWVLTNLDDGTEIAAAQSIDKLNEQLIPEYGFSVTIGQTDEPGDLTEEDNGAIGMRIEYADPDGPEWFVALPDQGTNQPGLDYIKTESGGADFDLDPNRALTEIGDGFFVPYYLLDYRENALGFIDYITPAWTPANQSFGNIVRHPPQSNEAELFNLNNVDIVFTSDKSKWSRCIVLETATRNYYDTNNGLGLLTELDAVTGCQIDHFDVRGGRSVTKDDNDGDGLPDIDQNATHETGFGYFPGYAVDVETGKRLNIFFGENSTYTCDQPQVLQDLYGINCENFTFGPDGRDMAWNPNNQAIFLTDNANAPIIQPYSSYLGGQHFIYVTDKEYDGCEALYEELRGCNKSDLSKAQTIGKNIRWAAMPMVAQDEQLLSYADGLIPNDLVVKIRVDNKYQVEEGTGVSGGYPTYEFEFQGVSPNEIDTDEEDDWALDFVNVVPNPYNARSFYEGTDNSTIVKITNLPAVCTVTIYSLDGRFVRQYKRNESRLPITDRRYAGAVSTQINPDIEWDLRNSKGVPIASGVYLIHIDAGDMGERVLKWFGVTRDFDPTGL